MDKKSQQKNGFLPVSECVERVKAELSGGTQIIADIKMNKDGNFYVSSYPDYSVSVSVSCLLSLQEDDRVRAVVDQRQLIVTDILVRKAPGALVINSEKRDLHFKAENIVITARKTIDIKGKVLNLFSGTANWVADRMYQLAHLLSVKADDAYREVENCDDVQAKNINHEAKTTLTIKGKLASVKGTAVLKVDGGQIHMG